MLAYITIGTNDFQRAVNFYDAIFNVLGYSRLPAWTDSWAMWGNENHPDDEFSFCICPPFDQHPATAGNGTMFWHAFTSIILLMQISYQAKKSHFNNKILR